HAAAREIEMLGPGIARVHLEVIAPVEVGGYTVQAGAFSDRERAESFRAVLGETFQDVRLVRAQGDSPLWRVLVGRQMTFPAASDLATSVKGVSGEAMVIRDR